MAPQYSTLLYGLIWFYNNCYSGKSRIEEVAERKAEGAEVERCGARTKTPKASRGVGCGEAVSPPHWVWGGGCATESGGLCPLPRIFFSIWSSKWWVLVYSGWHFEERGKQCFDGSGVLNLANCAVLYDYSAHYTVSLFETATAIQPQWPLQSS